MISSRPLFARWSGKKPRLPTMIPKVRDIYSSSVFLPCGREVERIKSSYYEEQRAPPDIHVQFAEHDARGGGVHSEQSHAQDQRAVDQEKDADKEPDRNRFAVRHVGLPE